MAIDSCTVIFEWGNEAYRPDSGMAEGGHLYFTKDKGNAYIGLSDQSLVPFNRSPYYCVCQTSAGSSAKTVNSLIDDEPFVLRAGTMVSVKFTNTNTASAPTLSVCGLPSPAARIKNYGTTDPGNDTELSWNAGEVVTFIYDGTYWQRTSHINLGTQPDWENDSQSSYAHILNRPNIRIGGTDDSITEGSLVLNGAKGKLSLASGEGTAAIGIASHSEGYGERENTIEGVSSVADETNTYSYRSGNVYVGAYVLYDRKIAIVTAQNQLRMTFSVESDLGRVRDVKMYIVERGAFGDYSHTEGADTNALGGVSHAEGYYTEAVGDVSHSEGDSTSSNGYASHSEGYLTIADSSYSHAEGYQTITTNDYEHASGKKNVSHTGTIMSVGTGYYDYEDEQDIGRNGMEIMVDGSAFIYGVGSYDGKTAAIQRTVQYYLDTRLLTEEDYDSIFGEDRSAMTDNELESIELIIDSFPYDLVENILSEAGSDNLEDLVSDISSDPSIAERQGMNFFRFVETVEIDGYKYHLWDGSCGGLDLELYGLMDISMTIEDLESISMASDVNNRKCPFVAFVQDDLSIRYTSDCDLNEEYALVCVVDANRSVSDDEPFPFIPGGRT